MIKLFNHHLIYILLLPHSFHLFNHRLPNLNKAISILNHPLSHQITIKIYYYPTYYHKRANVSYSEAKHLNQEEEQLYLLIIYEILTQYLNAFSTIAGMILPNNGELNSKHGFVLISIK